MEIARKLSPFSPTRLSTMRRGQQRDDETQFARNGRGIGSSTGMGICHSYTPDGRCVSLLKILLTNYFIYDCLHCINRASSNVRRARFTADEVVKLTLDFYRRNYISSITLSFLSIVLPPYGDRF